jgi:hypothetical protein
MSSTRLKIGKNTVALKYNRKMSLGEIKKMKSFVTNGGAKLVKTPKFKVLSSEDQGSVRTYRVVL